MHEGDGLGGLVDEGGVALVADSRKACGSGASEEVEDVVAGVRVDAEDAFENSERLLGGVLAT